MRESDDTQANSLARALRTQVLLHDPSLLDLYRAAHKTARREVHSTLRNAMRSVLEQASHDPGSPLGAYFSHARHSRASESEWLQVAEALRPHLQDDLSMLLRELLLRHAHSDLPTSGAVQVSLGSTTYACARYLAGVLRVWPAPGTTLELPTPEVQGERARESVRVRNLDATGFEAEELRAKTLMVLLSTAISNPQLESSGWYVRFTDLLRIFGYPAGERANSRYYWQHFTSVARSALIDLPGHLVRLGDGHDVPLLEVLQVVRRDPRVGLDPAWRVALRAPQARVEDVRKLGLIGVRYRFSAEVLEMLRGPAELEGGSVSVPVGFCALHGPGFWLAWRVARWSAWERHASQPFPVQSLLSLLQEAGYLRGRGVRRFKQAVRAWWQDVGALVDLGLLGEPGVWLQRRSGGHFRDCTDKLSRLLDETGIRLTAKYLEGVRVTFVRPEN